MVETGGLENRCTGNRTGGSNPSPSAIQSDCQRKPTAIFRNSTNERRFFKSISQTGPENVSALCSIRCVRIFFSEGQAGSPVSKLKLANAMRLTARGSSDRACSAGNVFAYLSLNCLDHLSMSVMAMLRQPGLLLVRARPTLGECKRQTSLTPSTRTSIQWCELTHRLTLPI